MAGLRVGQAYGVFHQPGFGLLVSFPRSLSTQPPFATQALTLLYCFIKLSRSYFESVYDTKIFISLFERAFKMMKNGVYFIVIALLVEEVYEILIYAN